MIAEGQIRIHEKQTHYGERLDRLLFDFLSGSVEHDVSFPPSVPLELFRLWMSRGNDGSGLWVSRHALTLHWKSVLILSTYGAGSFCFAEWGNGVGLGFEVRPHGTAGGNEAL